MIQINALVAIIVIPLLLTLTSFVKTVVRRPPSLFQIFAIVAIIRYLDNRFPVFSNAFLAHLDLQLHCFESVRSCYAYNGLSWKDNFGFGAPKAVAHCNAAGLSCHGSTARAFLLQVFELMRLRYEGSEIVIRKM